jgi:hypothetical protein
MNSTFSNYLLFEKQNIPVLRLAEMLCGYDRLVSVFNESERVKTVFSELGATHKHWLVCPEYGILSDQLPTNGIVTTCSAGSEDEAIQEFLRIHPIVPGEKLCIDTTGFIRPHLLYLLRHLFEHGCESVDMLYSEPMNYQKGSATKFSGEVTEVRQVRGFEGTHSTETDGEFLIVGCGYDSDLMTIVANSRVRAKKVQMFPFPSLRPHMYQENRLRTQECQVAFGSVVKTCFAPGYDPFTTAHVLSQFFRQTRPNIKNLYLTPLATKAQVIGFGLFYLMECLNEPVSILFPFSGLYNRETSTGLSEVWKYHIDFSLVRTLSK